MRYELHRNDRWHGDRPHSRVALRRTILEAAVDLDDLTQDVDRARLEIDVGSSETEELPPNGARRDATTFPQQLVDWLADDLQPFAAAQLAGHPIPTTVVVEDEWWTPTEAARAWGCSAAYVRRLAADEAIVAEKIGSRWRVAANRNRRTETQPRRAG